MNIFNKILKFNLINNNYILNKNERINFYKIESSYFNKINTLDGNGGIIYCFKGDLNLNNCIFYNCSCTFQGGAIYFNGDNIELIKICVNNCFASNFQFAYLQTHINIFLNLISINNCYTIPNGYTCFHLYKGNINLFNLNSSKNINYIRSGFGIVDPFIFKSLYCNIVDNYVSSNTIIYLTGNNNNFLSYFNIINNNSPKCLSIIYIDSGKYILNFFILFYNKNVLFHILDNSKLIILNSKINHLDIIFKGNISTNNIQFINDFNTLMFIHFSTKYCSANYLNNFQFTKVKSFNFYYSYLLIIFIFFQFLFKKLGIFVLDLLISQKYLV